MSFFSQSNFPPAKKASPGKMARTSPSSGTDRLLNIFVSTKVCKLILLFEIQQVLFWDVKRDKCLFEGRSSLDVASAAFTIRGLTPNDSTSYLLLINDNHIVTINLVVICEWIALAPSFLMSSHFAPSHFQSLLFCRQLQLPSLFPPFPKSAMRRAAC